MNCVLKFQSKLRTRHHLKEWANKGGALSRANSLVKIQAFVLFTGRRAEEVGKRHVYEFYTYLRTAGVSPRTMRDYHYAIRVLWVALGRSSIPPAP